MKRSKKTLTVLGVIATLLSAGAVTAVVKKEKIKNVKLSDIIRKGLKK